MKCEQSKTKAVECKNQNKVTLMKLVIVLTLWVTLITCHDSLNMQPLNSCVVLCVVLLLDIYLTLNTWIIRDIDT